MRINDTHDTKDERAEMFGQDIVIGHGNCYTLKNYPLSFLRICLKDNFLRIGQ